MTHKQERLRGKKELAEIDPEWLREMAEKEDNCILSVGGLVKRIEASLNEDKAK